MGMEINCFDMNTFVYVPLKALVNVASVKVLCTSLNMPSNVRLLKYLCSLNIFIFHYNKASVTNGFFCFHGIEGLRLKHCGSCSSRPKAHILFPWKYGSLLNRTRLNKGSVLFCIAILAKAGIYDAFSI